MEQEDDSILHAANAKLKRGSTIVACCRQAQHLTPAALELLEAAKTGDHQAVEALWEAVGPDAIPDWWQGGKERESARLAEALAAENPARVGEVVSAWTVPYLNRVAGGES